LARLAGVAYEGPDGSVVFRATNVDSIGRGAAERWSGADLATPIYTRAIWPCKRPFLLRPNWGN
jgi:hypothetical protein